MSEIWISFLNNPLAIPIVGIVVGVGVPVIGHFWFESEKHRRDSELKRSMIERGMFAEEIERILAAKSTGNEEEVGVR